MILSLQGIVWVCGGGDGMSGCNAKSEHVHACWNTLSQFQRASLTDNKAWSFSLIGSLLESSIKTLGIGFSFCSHTRASSTWHARRPFQFQSLKLKCKLNHFWRKKMDIYSQIYCVWTPGSNFWVVWFGACYCTSLNLFLYVKNAATTLFVSFLWKLNHILINCLVQWQSKCQSYK